jgi:hypothetical protein
MKVAWHEVPGTRAGKIRPVGYGMIRVAPAAIELGLIRKDLDPWFRWPIPESR